MGLLNVFQLGFAGPQEIVDLITTHAMWLRASLKELATFLASYRRDTRAAELLQTFSDRDLRDIGLSRSDVRMIAARTYRRD